MATHLIVVDLNKVDKSNGGLLNYSVGGLMHITVQTCYDLQYITMRLSGYMNAPAEPAFIDLKHSIEESPPQCYFKLGDAEINKTKEYSNFLHTYCDADHARDISDRCSVTSTVHLLNGTIIACCARK